MPCGQCDVVEPHEHKEKKLTTIRDALRIVVKAIDDAILIERELCAQAVESLQFDTEAEAGCAYFDGVIAKAIRNRGEK